MRLGRGVERQGQIGEDLTEEEVGASVALEQQSVLASPAQSAAAGELDFKYRRGVGEHPEGMGDGSRDALRQLLQALAQHLVIIASQRITRHVGKAAIGQHRLCIGRSRPVIEARADHPPRAGHELRGAGALHAVAQHIIHLAMKTGLQPGGQAGFGRAEIDIGHTNRTEAQFERPLADACEQGHAIDCDAIRVRETVCRHQR